MFWFQQLKRQTKLYCVDTLKRELICTNAYKLQASLSERVVVDGHGCNTDLNVGVKIKTKTRLLPKLHKNL